MPLEMEVGVTVVELMVLLLYLPLSTADLELESMPLEMEVGVTVVEMMVLRLYFPLSTADAEL